MRRARARWPGDAMMSWYDPSPRIVASRRFVGDASRRHTPNAGFDRPPIKFAWPLAVACRAGRCEDPVRPFACLPRECTDAPITTEFRLLDVLDAAAGGAA